MSDGKHIEICDKTTHQNLDRLPYDYTPCPTCGAKPVWDSITMIGGDKWPIIDRWECENKIESRTDGSPREDLESYYEQIKKATVFTNPPDASNCYMSICTDLAAGRDWSTSYIIDSVKHIRENIQINLSLPEYNPCDFPRPKLNRPQGDFNGIPYFVNQYLCEVKHVRFRLNHRKARINKKWHKKYGAISRCESNPVEMLNGTIIMCPCRERELKESIKNQTPLTV